MCQIVALFLTDTGKLDVVFAILLSCIIPLVEC